MAAKCPDTTKLILGNKTLRQYLWVVIATLTLCACNTSDPAPKKKKDRPAHLVSTYTSQIRPLSTNSTRTGTLQALRQVRIFNQEEGKINSLPHYPGDTFKKGNVLVAIDASLLQAELSKAAATRKQAELDLRRTTSLVAKRLAAEDERARIETALTVAQAEEQLLKTRLEYTTIHAPFSGLVSERLIEVGDIAPRYTHILTIIDRSSLIIRVNVSELLLPLFKIKDPASITIDALGKQVFKGHISRIYPTIDSVTRLGTLEISFKKIPPQARAGFLSRVTLTTPEQNYMLIPFSALRRDQQGEFVYTIDKDNKAIKEYVITGIRYQNFIAINEGLAENKPVIIKGFLGLKVGKKVTTTLLKKPDKSTIQK